MYDTIDPSPGEFGGWWWTGERKGGSSSSQHPSSSLCPVSAMWQVQEAAHQVATLYCNKVCVLDVTQCCCASPTGGATAQAAFTNKRVISTVRCVNPKTDESEIQRKEGEFTQLENELLAYVWLLNAVVIPLRYSLWDLTVAEADEGKIEQRRGMSMKSSIAQANPSENIYEIYYRLKQKGKEN